MKNGVTKKVMGCKKRIGFQEKFLHKIARKLAKIQNLPVRWRLQLVASSGKATLLSATPIPPAAQNKIFEKTARFQSQLFRKFGSQSVCPDKIRPKVDG